MRSLYIVATPIGNLKDITLRALRTLEEVELIAAEDTRTTRKLLNYYGIKTPLISFHEHNKRAKIPLLLEALNFKDVALVSEAGVPTISDPGHELVGEAIKAGVTVVPIPGPSALTAALSVSGIHANHFLFLGFLPRRRGTRRRLLEFTASKAMTIVFFEAPHRLRMTLEDMLSLWGDRSITVCRELTKVHEEVFSGTISEALARFTAPRGEFTLVIKEGEAVEDVVDEEWVRDELARLKESGTRPQDAVAALVQASGLPRRRVYQQWLALAKGRSPTS